MMSNGDYLFIGDHETADFDQYDSMIDAGNRLSITQPAAQACGAKSNWGLRVAGALGTTNDAQATAIIAKPVWGSYGVRFYLHPHDLITQTGEGVDTITCLTVYDNATAEFVIDVRLTSDESDADHVTIDVEVLHDGGSTELLAHELDRSEHWIEVRVVRTSVVVAADGAISIYVDGVLALEETGLEITVTELPDRITVGAGTLGLVDIGDEFQGSFYLDQIAVRDGGGLIGPDTGEGTIPAIAGGGSGVFSPWRSLRTAELFLASGMTAARSSQGILADVYEPIIREPIAIIGKTFARENEDSVYTPDSADIIYPTVPSYRVNIILSGVWADRLASFHNFVDQLESPMAVTAWFPAGDCSPPESSRVECMMPNADGGFDLMRFQVIEGAKGILRHGNASVYNKVRMVPIHGAWESRP